MLYLDNVDLRDELYCRHIGQGQGQGQGLTWVNIGTVEISISEYNIYKVIYYYIVILVLTNSVHHTTHSAPFNV